MSLLHKHINYSLVTKFERSEFFAFAIGKKNVPWFCLFTNKKIIKLLTFVTSERQKDVQIMSKMAVYPETSCSDKNTKG